LCGVCGVVWGVMYCVGCVVLCGVRGVVLRRAICVRYCVECMLLCRCEVVRGVVLQRAIRVCSASQHQGVECVILMCDITHSHM